MLLTPGVMSENTPVILAGNKTDLVRARQVTEEGESCEMEILLS